MLVTCAEIMTPSPVCLEPNAAVDLAARAMVEKDVGPILIVDSVDSMKLVGIVTDRDIVVKAVAENMDLKKTKIGQIMTPNPVTCAPGDDIKKAIQFMEQCQIRRVPVVDEQKNLVGIIAQADVATRLHKKNLTAEVVEEISKDIPTVPHPSLDSTVDSAKHNGSHKHSKGASDHTGTIGQQMEERAMEIKLDHKKAD